MLNIRRLIFRHQGMERCLCAIILCLLCSTGNAVWNCSIGTVATSKPGDPSFPQIQDSYHTNIEINIVDKNYTMDAEEYLDNVDNQGLMISMAHGVEVRIIYNYKTNEIYNIYNGHCTVYNLSASNETMLFGETEKDGRMHIYTASQALRIAKNKEQYVGPTRVRGIATQHWKACFFWAAKNENFTADYYFADTQSWQTASSSPGIPVRIEVQGIKTVGNGKPPYYLHHIYDFYRFRPQNYFDSSVFQIPDLTVCPGRKNTRSLPPLPPQYYYRQEIIDTGASIVKQSDIWYDYSDNLLRIDYHPQDVSNGNPVTEIHDFGYGVRYIKDRLLGNCTVLPLKNGSFDSQMDINALKRNNSFVLQMKHPLQFLYLDSNYTYSGQRYARGILCDVFTGIRSDYRVPGVTQRLVTILDYYFVSSGWSDLPNEGFGDYTTEFPIRLEVKSEQIGFHVIYNFVDFSKRPPDLSVFDISDCYGTSAKLHFKVRFPGPYKRNTENAMKKVARVQITTAMGVSPLRLQDVRVEYDNSQVFLLATLLDRVPPLAQFTHIPGKEMQRLEDMKYSNVIDPHVCADKCVSNAGIVCRSFDLCPKGGLCLLSTAHVADGNITLKDSTCDHFSRTVNSFPVKEKPASEAYGDFVQKVYSKQIQLDILEYTGESQLYTAVETEITLGFTNSKPLPSLGDRFSYHAELVIPSLKEAFDTNIWYNRLYKLVRFDTRNPRAPPYYNPYTMTSIHDFNTGIAYNIDQVMGNCTITPISVKDDFIDAEENMNAYKNGDIYVLQMKSAMDFFRLDNSYRYAGQQTVRGILCDVFEGVEENYHITGTNITSPATFQYFFQSSDWKSLAVSSTDETREQPVQLNIIVEKMELFMKYSITNFDEEISDMSVFDITRCFSDNQQHHFQITFNQPYFPYLNTHENLFKRIAALEMSQLTKVSPIRFQRLQVYYNLNSVYLVAILLGQADYILHFHNMRGKHLDPQTSKIYPGSRTADDCATACMLEKGFICNSFDICETTQTCLLSKLHVPDGPPVPNQNCTHYTRTVNGTGPATSMLFAYEKLTNFVYRHAFKVPISYGSQETFVYTATGIDNSIIRSNSQSGGVDLQQFTVYQNNVILMHYDFNVTLPIDQCAVACVEESRFDCNSFDYCFSTGTCLLSKTHPDEHPDLLQSHSFCDMYARTYLKEYTKYPGQVFVSVADAHMENINTANLCAQKCSNYQGFNCQSFDFCSSISSCRLRKTNILDVSDALIVADPICDHYSRNYINEFQLKNSSVIKGNDDVTVRGVSEDQCAKICVQQSDFECKSFEFCGNISECRLSSIHPKSAKNIEINRSAYCSLYTRYQLKDGTKYDPNAQTHYRNLIKTADDTGAKVGLGIGMLILGALIGSLSLYFFNYHRQKRGGITDGMNLHIFKEASD